MNTPRPLRGRFQGMPTTDGAGVELLRVIGQPALMQLDPFLLLDAFRSDNPEAYIAGFPPHPHRGFETVTYLIAGRMRHRDSAGHQGVIAAGGVQWMSAGKGIVHSEMPEQQNGLLQGFQLWINLPATHKMDPPRYQEFSPGQIPEEERPGMRLRVIAGRTRHGSLGPVQQPLTDPLFVDAALKPGALLEESVPVGHQAVIYCFEGQCLLPSTNGDGMEAVDEGQLGLLGHGDTVRIQGGRAGARLLLLAGRPLGEPIARGGPFVMNSEEELRQAFEDYRSGRIG